MPPREPAEPAESPSFREFDAHRYDYARIIALLEQILIAALRGDPSRAGIEPYVPVPASDRLLDEASTAELELTIAIALGKEV